MEIKAREKAAVHSADNRNSLRELNKSPCNKKSLRIAADFRNEILMHLRSLKKARKDVSLHDPIGTDKEGNEFTSKSYLLFTFNERSKLDDIHPFSF